MAEFVPQDQLQHLAIGGSKTFHSEPYCGVYRFGLHGRLRLESPLLDQARLETQATKCCPATVGDAASGYPKEPEAIIGPSRYAIKSSPCHQEDLGQDIVCFRVREASADEAGYLQIVVLVEDFESRLPAMRDRTRGDRIGHYAILVAGLGMHLYGRVAHNSVSHTKVQVARPGGAIAPAPRTASIETGAADRRTGHRRRQAVRGNPLGNVSGQPGVVLTGD
jgi:hypothetical protein